MNYNSGLDCNDQGCYFESKATNYFTLEEVELQQSYSREKSSLAN